MRKLPMRLAAVVALAVVAVGALALFLRDDDSAPRPAAAAQPPPVELAGFEGERLADMERLVSALGDDALVTSVEAGEPRGWAPEGQPGDVLLELRAQWDDEYVERLRAYWQAEMLLAAFWRERRAAGDESVLGGEIFFDKNGVTVREPGLSGYVFADDAETYLYTAPNDAPVELDVDEAAVERAIREAVAETDLTIDTLRFSGVLGSALELEATTARPVRLVRDSRARIPLFPPETLEGTFVTVRDADGQLVWYQAASAGLQQVVSGYGERYARYDPRLSRSPGGDGA